MESSSAAVAKDGRQGRGSPISLPEEADENTSEIRRAVEVLFKPGAVVELRAFKGRETVSGYFDDHVAFVCEAGKLEGQGYAVYITLNEVDPALLARAANRARKVYREPTTSDSDIEHRRWLPLDFDPARPSGVSATDDEKRDARRRALEIREHLRGLGWPESVVGDSGNGYHLLYRVDLPNDRGSLELVKGALEALAFRFSDGAVELDTGVHNAARIWKLYGATARKGDDMPERPHRSSKLLKVPEDVEVVGREQLEAVAVARPSPPPREECRSGPGRNGYREFDLAAWIGEHGVPVKREGPWEQGGYRWILEECPWNGHRDNAAYIVQHAGGAVSAGCHHNSCQTGGNRWRDLREHYEPGAYERGETSGVTPKAGEEWEDPEPLPEGLPPVATFDPAMLPGSLRSWVLDIAERMQVPLDYVAAGAVTVAASLIGRKIGIHPKRHDDWLVVTNLWTGVVGPPSTLKSPALAEITKPLDRLVAQAQEAHEEATEKHEHEVAVIGAEKAALKKTIESAAKASVKTGDRSELDNLIARQKDMAMSPAPTERRYRTSDTTVEKLAELLRENPGGILIQRDELTGWLKSLERQGREVDRAFYLESWNGTGSYSVDRIGRGTLHVPALCVSILGGIQPGPLSSYVYEAARGLEGADGLLQRFQLLVWPDPPRGKWRNVDRYPDSKARNSAHAVFQALDGLAPEEAGATVEEGIPAVRFSSDAQQTFDAWREELEGKLRDSDESPPALTSHLAKYRSLMPALALVFHLIDVVANDTADNPQVDSVGVEAAARAAAWCEYLETHAKRLYASAESPTVEGARALLSRIRKGDVEDGATIREVYRKQWSRLSVSEKVSAAAAMLEDYGWLRVEKVETGGRPTARLRLHPSLRNGWEVGA